MDARRDIFSGEKAPEAIFSVGPIEGFRKFVQDESLDLEYVHWDEPARDHDNLDRKLENVRLRMRKDEFWGGSNSTTYISEPETNPTWKDVLEFATEGIDITNDWHHVFLEAIHFSKDRDKDGRYYVDLSMGS